MRWLRGRYRYMRLVELTIRVVTVIRLPVPLLLLIRLLVRLLVRLLIRLPHGPGTRRS